MAFKYKWLADNILETIHKSQKKGIDKLPTEAQLCEQYQVSRQTVRQALALLEQKGLIEKKQGSGSFLTGLSEHSINCIVILVHQKEQYIYPMLLHEIESTLSDHGYSIQIFETWNRTDMERNLLHSLVQQPPRGIIIEGCKSALPNPNLDLYHMLQSLGTKLLFLHNTYTGLNQYMYLKEGNIQGSTLLANYLLAHGHTKIGGIFHAENQQGIERYQGFMEAMRDAKQPLPEQQIAWFRDEELNLLRNKHNLSCVRHWIQGVLHSCTAVICHNDEIAYWLQKFLRLPGITDSTIKELVSFDHSYLLQQMNPIISLSHQEQKVGQRAATMIMDALKGKKVTSRELLWEIKD